MPLPQDGKYRVFNHIKLGCLLYRYRILVQLMSAIEDKSIDYDKILKLTTYLLFAIPRQITYDRNIEGLCSCQHAFTNMWYKIDELPDLTENAVTGFSNDPYDEYYPISDT